MIIKTIQKDLIEDLLKEASKEFDIWKAHEDILMSPKDMFFPQVESIFKFENGRIKETLDFRPKFIFAIKPCDLKALFFVDEFFKRNFQDIYYLSRIKNRFVVVEGCCSPVRPQACFCTSAKTGPFAENGFDLQWIDSGNYYFVEAGSKKGEDFLAKRQGFFKDAEKRAAEEVKNIKQEASKCIEVNVDFQKALGLMTKVGFLPKENYERIGERCIYCGGCLYVCPTCTCFNVFDSMANKEGLRFRNWDGCVFEGYTREASGHNIRREKWLRTSRRYEHKLKYDYQTTGVSGCVGCGRCLETCPVEIGISKFIQEITENKKIM